MKSFNVEFGEFSTGNDKRGWNGLIKIRSRLFYM